MKYEIVIARHGTPLCIARANTLQWLVKMANTSVETMAKKGEPVDGLECIWNKFPDEETDDILMTSFDWEMRS